MRTNVVIDDKLINEAIKLSGLKTKKDVISFALHELAATRKRRNLLELEGKIKFRDDYDYKTIEEKLEALEKAREHLLSAMRERTHYRQCIEVSKQSYAAPFLCMLRPRRTAPAVNR